MHRIKQYWKNYSKFAILSIFIDIFRWVAQHDCVRAWSVTEELSWYTVRQSSVDTTATSERKDEQTRDWNIRSVGGDSKVEQRSRAVIMVTEYLSG